MSKALVYIVLVLSGTLFSCVTAVAQRQPVTLRVDSNAPEAAVYVDGERIGRAGARFFTIGPGAREVELVLTRRYSWSVPPISARLNHLVAGDTVAITLHFPYYYRFESVPHHAEVRLVNGNRTTPLGYTPTTIERKTPLSGSIDLELDGFRTKTVDPGSSIWNFHSVDLEPLDPAVDPSRLMLSRPERRRRWIDYAAVGTALVAGALAVHFKFEADERFDRYQETGDPDLRRGIKRYDVYSGIALGVMQAGVGVFAIRLALR